MQTGGVFCDIAPRKRTQNNDVRAVSRRKIRVACAVFLSPLEFSRANADVQRRASKGLRYTFAKKKGGFAVCNGAWAKVGLLFSRKRLCAFGKCRRKRLSRCCAAAGSHGGRGAGTCRCGFGAALLTLGGYSDKIYLLRHCQRARVCVI